MALSSLFKKNPSKVNDVQKTSLTITALSLADVKRNNSFSTDDIASSSKLLKASVDSSAIKAKFAYKNSPFAFNGATNDKTKQIHVGYHKATKGVHSDNISLINEQNYSLLRGKDALQKTKKAWESFVGDKCSFDMSMLSENEKARQKAYYYLYALESNYCNEIRELAIDSKLKEISHRILAAFDVAFKYGLANRIGYIYKEVSEEIVGSYSVYFATRSLPENSSLWTAEQITAKAYIQLLLDGVAVVCKYLPVDHVDFGPLSTVSSLFSQIESYTQLYKDIFDEQHKFCAQFLEGVEGADELRFSVFDWKSNSKLDKELLQAYKQSLSEPAVYNFWVVDYSKKSLSDKSPRCKILLVLLRHGMVLISADRNSKLACLTKFSPLKTVEVLPHPDPSLAAALTLKFVNDDALFLVECHLEELLEDFLEKFRAYQKHPLNIHKSLAASYSSERLNEVCSIERTESSQPQNHHSSRTRLLEECREFLLPQKHLSFNSRALFHFYDPEKARWISKSKVEIMFCSNEERFAYLDIHSFYTGILLHNFWLYEVVLMKEISGSRLLICTANGCKVLLKFDSSDEARRAHQAVDWLLGNTVENGLHSVASGLGELRNPFYSSRLKFYAYPVFHHATGTVGYVQMGMDDVVRFTSFCKRAAVEFCVGDWQLAAGASDSPRGWHVSKRHAVLHRLGAAAEIVLCFRFEKHRTAFAETWASVQHERALADHAEQLLEALKL